MMFTTLIFLPTFGLSQEARKLKKVAFNGLQCMSNDELLIITE